MKNNQGFDRTEAISYIVKIASQLSPEKRNALIEAAREAAETVNG